MPPSLKTKPILLVLLLLNACAGTQLVGTWKNPDHVVFTAKKVLVVAMARDRGLRMDFEDRFVQEFKRKGVEAMASIDVFDLGFTEGPRSEAELGEAVEILVQRDFDAILLTKVTGRGHRVTLTESVAHLDKVFDSFGHDYLDHQEIYYGDNDHGDYDLYHFETSLYCICIGKERELIWRGHVDQVEPRDRDKAMDAYIDLVREGMADAEVIF